MLLQDEFNQDDESDDCLQCFKPNKEDEMMTRGENNSLYTLQGKDCWRRREKNSRNHLWISIDLVNAC